MQPWATSKDHNGDLPGQITTGFPLTFHMRRDWMQTSAASVCPKSSVVEDAESIEGLEAEMLEEKGIHVDTC